MKRRGTPKQFLQQGWPWQILLQLLSLDMHVLVHWAKESNRTWYTVLKYSEFVKFSSTVVSVPLYVVFFPVYCGKYYTSAPDNVLNFEHFNRQWWHNDNREMIDKNNNNSNCNICLTVTVTAASTAVVHCTIVWWYCFF